MLPQINRQYQIGKEYLLQPVYIKGLYIKHASIWH